MEIPLKIRLPLILKQLADFSVVHFQDNSLEEPKGHWYVLIPVPGEDAFIIVMITSKIDKRIKYYTRRKQPRAAGCLVRIGNDEFSFLDRNSAVECNRAEHVTIPELIHRIDEAVGFNVEAEKVPEYMKKEIVSAIIKSPIVPPVVGKMAKAANPI